MNSFVRYIFAIALVILLSFAIAPIAQAQTESLLYQFTGAPDGASPYAGPTLKGTTLYGTTMEGGTGPGDTGYGIVYAISTTTGKETILHTFTANTQTPYDGVEPLGGLVLDKKGNLYGTTLGGGMYDAEGYGTIYEIAKSGKQYVEKVIYAFSGGLDGGYPYYVTPVFDKSGNLYGTTAYGGSYGNGVVFKLSPGGVLTTLHSFYQAGGDGYNPDAGVALDTKGNVYGTAPGGGAYGYGVLYEITASGQYSILYNFTGGTDGGTPRNALVYKGGKLYGTAQSGGAGCTWGCGADLRVHLGEGQGGRQRNRPLHLQWDRRFVSAVRATGLRQARQHLRHNVGRRPYEPGKCIQTSSRRHPHCSLQLRPATGWIRTHGRRGTRHEGQSLYDGRLWRQLRRRIRRRHGDQDHTVRGW